MKIKKMFWACLCLWTLIGGLNLFSKGVMAQNWATPEAMPLRQEELDQMVAPIALYPDELLSQILMAATYPLEVIEAARWSQANPGLRGDSLSAALEQKNWDPSVKSLVNFPSVLQMMNDNLEWMERLGEAFLTSPDRVMNTVQNLREMARAQGNLKNTWEQRILTDPQSGTIIIEPASPEVVYVPVYDPMVIYGPWWWPAYHPFTYYPRGGVVPGRFLAFGAGVPIGAAWGYAWGGFDWLHHRVLINRNRNSHLNPRIDRPTRKESNPVWVHDPNHRRGLAYRSPTAVRQFGGGTSPGADGRRAFRGFYQPGTVRAVPPVINRPSGPVPVQNINPVQINPAPVRKPPEQIRPQQMPPSPGVPKSEPPKAFVPAMPPARVTTGPGPVRPERVRPPVTVRPEPAQRLPAPSAFGGFGQGGQTRQDSFRGHQSLSGGKAGGPAAEHGRPAPAGGPPVSGSRQERGK
jgi:hypothetical protein